MDKINRLLFFVIFCCTFSVSAEKMEIAFEQYTLKNGMTVILHEDRSAPVAAVMVMYHVGSKNEKPKRTGFAHLFEHMMFQGSANVGDDEHFKMLQEVGANINGTTNEDRTNYFEVVPSNYLELALYLESDRMGFLLPAMTQTKLDNQRDVVKNERRQSYDNQPYGTSSEKISAAMFPAEHPYHWPVIGYMEDLSAAAMDDVQDFFKTYYAPNNACLVIAGDFEKKQTKDWVEKYFGEFSRGKDFDRPRLKPVSLSEDKRMVFEDKVKLPRLYLSWVSAPMNTREDAVLDVLTDILSAGKTSRLYKSLVYEKQIAQSAFAFQGGMEIAGQLELQVTAKPEKTLAEMETAVNEVLDELLNNGVTQKEIDNALTQKEAQLVNGLSTVLGKANQLASYYTYTGDPGNINKELERFKGITAGEILAVAKKYLTAKKIVLSIVPEGKTNLAATNSLQWKGN
ncbi:MAG: insulinase family protein [Ignavibacteriales bacterium]|nr:insulinase family protein [Ignavibacteriales bacterium]